MLYLFISRYLTFNWFYAIITSTFSPLMPDRDRSESDERERERESQLEIIPATPARPEIVPDIAIIQGALRIAESELQRIPKKPEVIN